MKENINLLPYIPILLLFSPILLFIPFIRKVIATIGLFIFKILFVIGLIIFGIWFCAIGGWIFIPGMLAYPIYNLFRGLRGDFNQVPPNA